MTSTFSKINENVSIGKIEYWINTQNINYNELLKIKNDIDDNTMYYFKVLYSGIYILNISCLFEESCIIGLFINEVEDSVYETYELTNKNHLMIHQIIYFNLHDIISFKYLSINQNKLLKSENKIKIWKL